MPFLDSKRPYSSSRAQPQADYILPLIAKPLASAENHSAMPVRSRRTRERIPGGFFHLEEERTKTRVSGYGYGDHIRLKDEYGNEWLGSAYKADDGSVIYRFRDRKGRSLTGISDSFVLTLRDEKGSTWKGFIE